MMTEHPAHGPLPWLLLLLSLTTGLVDAISVLGLDKVFTANMTGNIVFLGFAAVGTPGFQIAPYLAAIFAFLFGALAAGRAGKAYSGRQLRHWLLTTAAIEAGALWLAAGAVHGFGAGARIPEGRMFLVLGLTAFAMGVRNATVRLLKVPDLTTTVLTLTLTGLAAESGLAGGANVNWRRRVGSVGAIFAGAGLGAALVLRVGLALPLALAGLLALTGTAAYALHPTSRARAG